jgi:nucleoid DNA-binding protein
MAESERIPRRDPPVQTCPACGSTWFREATFYQWPAASSAGAKPMTSMLQTILVCLCGTPVPSRWGGIRGGKIPNVEMAQFQESLERVKDVLATRHREAVKQQAVEMAGPRQPVQALGTALTKVERALGRLQARVTAKGKTGQERNWQPPQRQVSKPVGREYLELELQKRTFTFRQARQVVDAIWESIKDALKRGEDVETPLGRFQVVERPEPRKRLRLGKIQRLYRQRKKVVFTAAKEVG